ncbi:tail fiber protein [Nostoc sp. CENA67]|uniref:Tail fiber protein n=1 Tax=Amazonocrinis nigriterrae CENA67 TaxID=2794033 RepID=A0A8J7LAJ2_9NOST|nr:tail fiber protein [Amazonocrinis nigriterrae]MBH8565553.1 tail fiber protein [Amazonocrinis nigriterrae CENA67]
MQQQKVNQREVKDYGITVSTTDSNWQSQGPNPLTVGDVVRALQWTFTPSSADVDLGAQETLKIDISKIKTSHPTGATKLYLGYKYVPEYQHGEFIYPIEKAPLVFDDYKVGIGTSKPAESLHITGGNLKIDERIKDKTGYVMPVGSILPYAGSTAPEGWLFCDGQEYTTSEYQDLFDVITTQYGGTESNFNVPNLQGRVPVGYKENNTNFSSLGQTGGEERVTLEEKHMPNHNHLYDDHYFVPCGRPAQGGGNYTPDEVGKNGTYENQSTGGTGGGESHNNLQPYLTVNFIIKF